MTAIVSTGASSATPKNVWSELPWPALNGLVLRLQQLNAWLSIGLHVIRGKTPLELMGRYGVPIDREYKESCVLNAMATHQNR
jgi:hypothetical protein